jgi:hypothetical protein
MGASSRFLIRAFPLKPSSGTGGPGKYFRYFLFSPSYQMLTAS